MNWRELNKSLSSMTEDQVRAMLDAEMATNRRVSVVERLHQRYTSLRASRERIELLRAASGVKE